MRDERPLSGDANGSGRSRHANVDASGDRGRIGSAPASSTAHKSSSSDRPGKLPAVVGSSQSVRMKDTGQHPPPHPADGQIQEQRSRQKRKQAASADDPQVRGSRAPDPPSDEEIPPPPPPLPEQVLPLFAGTSGQAIRTQQLHSKHKSKQAAAAEEGRAPFSRTSKTTQNE